MKNILVLSFIVFILAALGVSVIYTATRLRTLFGLNTSWPLSVLIGSILIVALVTSSIAVQSTNPIVSYAYIISGYFLYFYICMLLLLLSFHIVQYIANIPSLWTNSAAIIIALFMTVIGAINAQSFKVTDTSINIANLQKPITIMQISDVHIGHHRGRAYLEKIIDATNKQNSDLVVITGDLVDSDFALLPGTLDPLSRLKAPAYFIIGNHEEAINLKQALADISKQGIHVLNNQIIETHGIQIIGLDYMDADENAFNLHPSHKTDTVKSVLSSLSLKTDIPSILLHHSPAGAQYAVAKNIDVMLSGHTHGGQVFPFTQIAKIFFPYNRGLYTTDNTKIFVSSGAGTFMMRARLGSPNEINFITLTPTKK
jgi:predicted MPP superfamily phosphohydrolase